MSDWLEFSFGDLRWRVRPDWHERLFLAQRLRLAEWRDQGLVETIKQAPHRTVSRIQLPEASIYLKHYPVADLRSFVRQLVRPAKARGEFTRLLAVAERGIPTIEPLALGETLSGESYLITLGVADAQPMHQFLEKRWPTLPNDQRHRFRIGLTEKAADLLVQLHEAGIRHYDLHVGNILVQPDPHGTIQLYLIDLHEVQIGGPLDWRASRDNLVLFNHWFAQRVPRTDRCRFWLHYLHRRQDWNLSRSEERARVLELEKRTWASCLHYWRKRDRRCLSSRRYFYHSRRKHAQAWSVVDFPPKELHALLADPDAPFKNGVNRVLKHSRSSTVAELALPMRRPGAGRADQGTKTLVPMIYKRFAVTKRSDPLLALMRATPALRSWVNGHRLLNCGIPTARPLAVIHRRRYGLTWECYLLTEKLSETIDLRRYVAGLRDLSAAECRARLVPLVDKTAQLVRALHRRRLSHRDLKAANILVRPEADGSAGRLFLIDLVGLQRRRTLSRRIRLKNLARLNASASIHPCVSRSDRLRFLRAYFAWGLRGKNHWKRWWRQIAQATQEKIAQNQRRGRPLA